MEKQYLTVTALTRYIKTKIEYDPHLQSVWLKVKFPTLKIIAVVICILH